VRDNTKTKDMAKEKFAALSTRNDNAERIDEYWWQTCFHIEEAGLQVC
jgi:hypothetical protein